MEDMCAALLIADGILFLILRALMSQRKVVGRGVLCAFKNISLIRLGVD